MDRTSVMEQTFQADAALLWEVVTNNEDTAWRSDIVRTEVVSADRFTEYTEGGGVTEFQITKKIPEKAYAFTIKNKMFQGEWEGTFERLENGGTKVRFQETLHIKNPLIWLLSFFAMPLKKVQKTYFQDLKKKIGE